MSLDFYLTALRRTEVFSGNVTHNLGEMAKAAGIYRCLWRPQENGYQYAEEIIEPLEKGLALLRSDPERFKKFNPPNGWGSYEVLVHFVENCLQACKENPDAEITIWK